jgi:hypothetical protein
MPTKKQSLLNKMSLITYLKSKGFTVDNYGHYLQPNKTNTRVIRVKLSDISYRIEYKVNKPNSTWVNYIAHETLYYSDFDGDLNKVSGWLGNLINIAYKA